MRVTGLIARWGPPLCERAGSTIWRCFRFSMYGAVLASALLSNLTICGPFGGHGARTSTWSAISQARADDDDENEGEKKSREREREAEKQRREQESEEAKQQQERAREQQSEAREQQREQEQQALERQFEQSKKALERSGKGEKEIQALENDYEREKRGLEHRYERNGDEVPRTLVDLVKRIFKPRSEGSESNEANKADGREPQRDSEHESRRASKQESERDSEHESRRTSKQEKQESEREPKQESERDAKPKRVVGRSKRSSTADRGSAGSFKRSEVVAVNLTNKGRGKAQKLGFRVVSSSNLSGFGARVTRLRVPPGLDAWAARQLLKREIPSDSFELNKVYHVYREARETNDSNQGVRETDEGLPAGRRRHRRRAGSVEHACDDDHCFARSAIRWKDALASCSKGIRVGIIDTTIDLAHPTFRGQNITAGSFIPDHRYAASDAHGTAVASMLAGSHDSGTPGLIPDAAFFAANIFYMDEDGHAATDTVSLLKALDWMDAWDVRVINMSFTGPEDALVHEALKRMMKKHVVFVAAGGNEGPAAPPRYPAAYPEVVAVTAVNRALHNYPRANRGSYVDVAAPGVDIWTAYPNGHEGYRSGTSFAAPHVTALLATIYKDRGSFATPQQLIEYLPVRDLGSRGPDPVYGRGLAQAPADCRGADRKPDAALASTSTFLRHVAPGASWALDSPVEPSSWQPLRPVRRSPVASFR